METKVVGTRLSDPDLALAAIKSRLRERFMTADEWIETHASGTLRKNKRIGFAWKQQYMHERIAYEFGYAFEILPKTRVVYNDPITEGDCHAISEAGWFVEKYLTFSLFPEDQFETKYIIVEEPSGLRREGVGIIVKQTSFPIPEGNIVFAIIAEYDLKTKSYLAAKNPF